jgi:hypothetical protein
LFVLLLLVGMEVPAMPQSLTFDANLDGGQEVPPNSSPGNGFCTLTLDTSGDVTVSEGSYADLLGNSSAVTLSGSAGYGQNAATLLVFTLNSPGTTAGTFSGSGTLTPTQVGYLESGQTYINIRSNVYPSGEIRGQVEVVPEPATLTLLGTALLGRGVIYLRRRRAKA